MSKAKGLRPVHPTSNNIDMDINSKNGKQTCSSPNKYGEKHAWITMRDRKTNEWIREKTKVQDIMKTIKLGKWT